MFAKREINRRYKIAAGAGGGGSYVWIYLVINHISTDTGSVVNFFKALKCYIIS